MNPKKLKICMAQIDVVPGNPRANTKTMLGVIEKAKKDGAELIVFSEMVIPGYILGDMWERQSFLDECEDCGKEIIMASQGTAIIFGNIVIDRSKVNEDGRVRKYNTAIVAIDGVIVDKRVKSLQPNYREFDDNRHFYDNRKLLFDRMASVYDVYDPVDWIRNEFRHSFSIKGIKIGVMLCEDGWSGDYTISPADYLYKDSDILINISCSPYTYGKNDKRNRVFSAHALKHKKPLVYVNNVGVQNNGKTVYTFDGNSCIYDKAGKMFNPYPKFASGDETFDIDLDSTFAANTTIKRKKVDHFYFIGVSSDTLTEGKDNIGDIHKTIEYGCRKFMEAAKIKKVVVGASGGIDSSVVATFMCDIVGPENLILVNMPSRFNSDLTKNAAKQLATNLRCKYLVVPIEDSVELTKKQLKEAGLDYSELVVENIQARDRSSRILAAIASSVGGVFTCNANKSEMTVGYTTLYGDLGGFLAPIGDLWKGQVYELANYINSISGVNIIPLDSINVVPSAELSDKQNVTKGLGDPIIYPYHDLLFSSWVERWNRATPEDILLWLSEGTLEKNLGWFKKPSILHLFNYENKKFIDDLEKWWNLHVNLAIAKRVQAPPIIAVSRRVFGFDMRESLGCTFYTRKYLELKEKILHCSKD